MIFKMQISMLIDHPRNMEIYGEEDQKQFDELVEQIRLTGWIKPILINRNFMIISGHRRVRAAKVLGRTEIEVEKFMGDEDQELERLVLENFIGKNQPFQRSGRLKCCLKLNEGRLKNAETL